MNPKSSRAYLAWTGVTVLALIGTAAAARGALILLFGFGTNPAVIHTLG